MGKHRAIRYEASITIAAVTSGYELYETRPSGSGI
jgi:hypothetical protein